MIKKKEFIRARGTVDYKCKNGFAPEYFSGLRVTRECIGGLQSNEEVLLVVPRIHQQTYRVRAFYQAAAPTLWYSLP